MSYSNLWLSVNAFILDVILLYVFHEQKGNESQQRTMYRAMLLDLLALNSICFIYVLILRLPGNIAILETVISWVVSIVIAMMPMFLLAYLNSIYYYDIKRKKTNRILNILGLIMVIAAVVPYPAVVSMNRQLVLSPGFAMVRIVLPSILFLIIGIVQGSRLKDTVSPLHTMALHGIGVIYTIAMICFCYFRNASVYGFMLSLYPLLAVFTIEGKGVLFDQDTGLRSRNAYRISVIRRIEEHTPFRLILVHSPNLSSVLSGLDEKSGDKVLGRVSHSLREITSLPTFRIREDTFAILQEEKNEIVTQEILIGLKTHFLTPVHVDGKNEHITVHACIINLPEQVKSMKDLEILTELLAERSDRAVGSEVQIGDLDIDGEKVMRSQIQALNAALQEKRLELWYQPIYSTQSGMFESAEALIRMKDPEGKYIRPDHFIPAAERSGLIIRVGYFVIEEVCRFLATKQCETLGVHYIEANLSVEECIQEGLPDVIKATMDQYGIRSDEINIEVTETADDTASELMMRNMALIHENLGVELSLDDFGTGYSNLARVLSMPVGIIKFDRSMLLKAFESQRGKEVFSRLADAVHKIGRKIVSEGVETEEQAEFVKSLGIEYIQGFYYAKPMPEADYIEFLKQHQNRGTES